MGKYKLLMMTDREICVVLMCIGRSARSGNAWGGGGGSSNYFKVQYHVGQDVLYVSLDAPPKVSCTPRFVCRMSAVFYILSSGYVP